MAHDSASIQKDGIQELVAGAKEEFRNVAGHAGMTLQKQKVAQMWNWPEKSRT